MNVLEDKLGERRMRRSPCGRMGRTMYRRYCQAASIFARGRARAAHPTPMRARTVKAFTGAIRDG